MASGEVLLFQLDLLFKPLVERHLELFELFKFLSRVVISFLEKLGGCGRLILVGREWLWLFLCSTVLRDPRILSRRRLGQGRLAESNAGKKSEQ